MPYSILFGPDHCGIDREGILLQFQRPQREPQRRNGTAPALSYAILQKPPAPFIDSLPHLYTLVLQPSGDFTISIDRVELLAGSLREQQHAHNDDDGSSSSSNSNNNIDDAGSVSTAAVFAPPFFPPRKIPDPADRRPPDYPADDIEPELIPDPLSRKPADWDETEPEFIPDPAALQPQNWREDLPAMIRDTTRGGKLIPNPHCEKLAGCGPWSRPKMRNPKFRGMWKPAMVRNPRYRPPWKPRLIDNPQYNPDWDTRDILAVLPPIDAVGFELFTQSAGVMIDNIYVGHGIEDSERIAELTWAMRAENLGWSTSKARDRINPRYARGSALHIVSEIYRENKNIFISIVFVMCLATMYLLTWLLGQRGSETPAVGAGMIPDLAAELDGFSDGQIGQIVRLDREVNEAARSGDEKRIAAALRSWKLRHPELAATVLKQQQQQKPKKS